MKKVQLNILVAPLDWGLGHLTRCIPMIEHILRSGHQVFFAGNASQRRYIRDKFPDIPTLDLEGYNVHYTHHPLTLIPKIIGQIPRIRKQIRQEQDWLRKMIHTHKIDGVISDNRYGLHSKQVPCIFMTHQLKVRTRLGHWADRIIQRFHYRFIEKFECCWVVDIPEAPGLSGELAHTKHMPAIRTEYIGLLSQCAGRKKTILDDKEDYVLILLSGAEPQRTVLSDLLWRKAVKSDRPVIFVAGSEEAKIPENIPAHISFHKRLSSENLLIAINAASVVVCRSGYSSLMDLVALKKKAILIPTPGQSEQEYLARIMHRNGYFMRANQNKFDLHTSLLNAALFPFDEKIPDSVFTIYRTKLDIWLKSLNTETKN